MQQVPQFDNATPQLPPERGGLPLPQRVSCRLLWAPTLRYALPSHLLHRMLVAME